MKGVKINYCKVTFVRKKDIISFETSVTGDNMADMFLDPLLIKRCYRRWNGKRKNKYIESEFKILRIDILHFQGLTV